MGATQQFSLRWNNYVHHITNAFDSLRSCEDLIDVTLVCDRKKIYAHKMLLSACSEYFRDVFKENPCKHPVIIFRNVKYEDLVAIIDFMYHGEVNVEQEQLTSFLTTAEMLAVQGLSVGSTPQNKDDNRKKQAIFVDSNTGSVSTVGDAGLNRHNPAKLHSRPAVASQPVQNPHSAEFASRTPPVSDSSSLNSPPRKRRPSPSHGKLNNSDKTLPKKRQPIATKEECEEDADTASFGDEDGMMDVSELDLTREGEEASRIKEEPIHSPEEVVDKLTAMERTGQAGTSRNQDAIGKGAGGIKWVCEMCGKIFKHKDSLRQHNKIHQGSTKCPICNNVLSRKYELKVHMRKIHNSPFLGIEGFGLSFPNSNNAL